MLDKNIKIGIVGYGQMGAFMAKLLQNLEYNVQVYDPNLNLKFIAEERGVDFCDLDIVCLNDIIFLFPDISKFEECCQSIAKLLRKDSMVIEGCSVMSKPVELMKKYLPKNVELLACHPLFGPQSGQKGVDGLVIVSTPIRTKNINLVNSIYNKMGLKIVSYSPEEHDILMSKTQVLEQIIGQLLIRMNIKKEKLSTPGYNLLVQLKNILEQDSISIFKNVQTMNPFAENILQNILNMIVEMKYEISSNNEKYEIKGDIATLGPKGTDSENAAKTFKKDLGINGSIRLFSTFEEAIKYAENNNAYLLIPSAFNSRNKNGNIKKSWADINFHIEDNEKLELYYVDILPLKDICIARNKKAEKIILAGTHPATKYYLEKYYPDIEIKYYDSKPIVVQECNNGVVDICVGSVDVVRMYDNLEVLYTFKSKMCWTLYKPKSNNHCF